MVQILPRGHHRATTRARLTAALAVIQLRDNCRREDEPPKRQKTGMGVRPGLQGAIQWKEIFHLPGTGTGTGTLTG